LRGQSLRPVLQTEPETIPLEVLTLNVGLLIALTYTHDGFGPLVIFGAFIFIVSVLLRRRFEQLQQRVTQLGALNEIGHAISATLDVSQLTEKIYRESSRVIDTTNFYIALYDAARDEVTFILDVTDGQLNTTPEVQRGRQGLTEHVIRTRASLLLPDDVPNRTRALGLELVGHPARCWLGVPMAAGDQVIGMIAAQNYTTPHAFTQEHVDILATIAAQAAVAIQNARLLEEVAEKERLRQELALARAIQQSLLPDPPQIPGLFLASRCLPAQETGGDLFDFIPVDEHHLGIAIGDAVGKGMPAALLMATTRSMLRAYAQNQPDPAAVLEAVNRALYEDTKGKTFVSLCYLVLDLRDWTTRLASAGHLYPLLCDENNEPIYLESPGCLPVGVEPQLRCASLDRPLRPGQAILLYTDGVVEAHDVHGRLLSFDRLRAIVARQSAERLIDAVLEGVAQFAGSVAPDDDLTLVVIKRS
jgi:sigma-B regulation protein RsbU (phosphoserine phosphatase)